MYKLPERRGGGEVIRAMPERKHLFFREVFPYSTTVLHPSGVFKGDDDGDHVVVKISHAQWLH